MDGKRQTDPNRSMVVPDAVRWARSKNHIRGQARLVPRSSSFRKPANLMWPRLLVYSGGFLSSNRTACPWLLVTLCCTSSVQPSDPALYSLTYRGVWPMQVARRLEGGEGKSPYLLQVASLRGGPRLVMPFGFSGDNLVISTLVLPGLRAHFAPLHLGLREVTAPPISCGIARHPCGSPMPHPHLGKFF